MTGAQRMNEMMGEFEGGMPPKLCCDESCGPGRVMKTACNRAKKCRSHMLQEAYDNDYEEMEEACRLARRRYTVVGRKGFARGALSVGNRHDPKKRAMQVCGVGVCLSFWAWWHGISKGTVSPALQELKTPTSGGPKGDLRLVSAPKEWAIKAPVCKWMKVCLGALCQDNPELGGKRMRELAGGPGVRAAVALQPEADGGVLQDDLDVEGRQPRKFMGGLKVRVGVGSMHNADYNAGASGGMLYCSPGYFKAIFLSQYGPKTGPETGNFYATGAKRSLMGGYCDSCSRAAINISSTDAMIRKKGRGGQQGPHRVDQKNPGGIRSGQGICFRFQLPDGR